MESVALPLRAIPIFLVRPRPEWKGRFPLAIEPEQLGIGRQMPLRIDCAASSGVR